MNHSVAEEDVQESAKPAAITASEDSGSVRQESTNDERRTGFPCTSSPRKHARSESGQNHSKKKGKKKTSQDNYNEKEDEESRRMKRVMANRRSARESRERRKRLIGDLEVSVDRLATENAQLEEENLAMKRELQDLLREAAPAMNHVETSLDPLLSSIALFPLIQGNQDHRASTNSSSAIPGVFTPQSPLDRAKGKGL